MPVLGIQNFDRWTKRVEAMGKAAGEKVRDQALEAAGEVLLRALESATPVRQTKQVKGPRAKHWHPPGTARRSVINVPARMKQYGVSRRLIGYSKNAYYMLFVEQHRGFMKSVFKSNIGRAMEVAKEVIRKAARGESAGKAA